MLIFPTERVLLLLSAATGDDTPTVFENGSNTEIIKDSLKYGVCMFCATTHQIGANSRLSMVQCDTCSTWYHCVCIGVHVDHFDNGKSFNCCIPTSADTNFE